jgi:hypothetical protein
MSTTTYSPLTVKVMANVLISASLDRLVNKQTDLTKNLTFGVQSGLGVYVGNKIGSYFGTDPFPSLDDTNTPQMYTSGGLVQRASEITGSSLSTYYLSKYMGGNSLSASDSNMNQKLIVLAASDMISEYASQYFTSNPLMLFAPY